MSRIIAKRQNNSIKSLRFLKPLEEYKNFILIQSPNLSAKKTVDIRKNIEEAHFILKMTLKRLVHKMLCGDRDKNTKTRFKGNLYMAIPKAEADYAAFMKTIKTQKCEIAGIVNNGQIQENYQTYLMCEFDKTRLIAILIKILLFPPVITLNYITNKLRSK